MARSNAIAAKGNFRYKLYGMRLFLIVFIAIYGSAHLYFYRKMSRAFSLSLRSRLAVGTALLVSTVSPLLVRVAEQHEHPILASFLAYPGYFWMAILFLFLVLSASGDVAAAFIQLFLIIRRKARRTRPFHKRRQFQICFGLALGCALYGMFEAQDIRTERIVIATPKLPHNSQLRIVQLSDVHLGILMGRNRLERIIGAARDAKPDILVSTGDLIDGILTHEGFLLSQFQQINPRLGAYAVPGNHEYHVGFARARQMTEDAGFTLLKGESVVVGPILIAGADDPAARRTDNFTALAAVPHDAFTLLLKHQPRISTEVPFDLQLSGHVHKGQIFPFNVVTWLSFRLKCGLTQLADGQQLYVSRGTGTWGPPIRFLAPPEITIIDLVASDQ